jgi:hypothetical protein
MRDIRSVLNEKQQQMVKLQREIEALRLAISLLGSDGSEPVIDINTELLSQPKMIASILEANGRPMHVREIAYQLKKRFNLETKKSNLGVMLFRYSKRGSTFYKEHDKPNTYGLLKWVIANESKTNSFEDRMKAFDRAAKVGSK